MMHMTVNPGKSGVVDKLESRRFVKVLQHVGLTGIAVFGMING
jgi:hypothetical protein